MIHKVYKICGMAIDSNDRWICTLPVWKCICVSLFVRALALLLFIQSAAASLMEVVIVELKRVTQ